MVPTSCVVCVCVVALWVFCVCACGCYNIGGGDGALGALKQLSQ